MGFKKFQISAPNTRGFLSQTGIFGKIHISAQNPKRDFGFTERR
jgi:hypothetical protein